MPRYWTVQATITRSVGELRVGAKTRYRTEQIPTFLLDSHIQGIRDLDHARKVADSIVRTLAGPGTGVTFEVAESLMD